MGKKSAAIKDMHWGLVGNISFSMAAYQGFSSIYYKEGWRGIISELGSLTTHGTKNTKLAFIVWLAVAIYLTINALIQGKLFGKDSLFTKKNMKDGLIMLLSLAGPVYFMSYMARISDEVFDSQKDYGATIAFNYILSTVVNFVWTFIVTYGLSKLSKANHISSLKLAMVNGAGLTGGLTGGLLYDMLIKIIYQPEYFFLQSGMGALGAAINATVGLGLHSLYDKCFGKTKNENEESGLLLNNDLPLSSDNDDDDDDDDDTNVGCCARKKLTGNLT